MASPPGYDEETERLFGKAANHMRKVQDLKLSSERRLEFYALFKQATEGDCDEPKPGLIDLVGRAKWGAWDKLRGNSPVEAMEAYVIQVSVLCPGWLKEPQGEAHGDDAGIQLQDELNKELAWEGNDAEEEEEDRGAGLAYGVTVSTMAEVQGNLEDWGANEQIFAAASGGDISRLEDIVSSGVKVNVQDEEGRTPLHFAADRGQSAAISRLLELGALVDARDADGMTPLACAVACENVQEIQLLVKAGADINCADNDGSSPVSIAEESVRHLLLLPKELPAS